MTNLFIFLSYVLFVFIGFAIFYGKNLKLQTLAKLSLNILPYISTIIVKRFINTILSRFCFTNRATKMLALTNFRVYNVYLFLNFYFSYLLGLFSIIFKLSKAFIANISI